jgi:hypothetical protein
MKTFRFWVDKFVRVGDSSSYFGVMFDSQGETIEEARAKIEGQVPEGHRIMAQAELPVNLTEN